jgi:uncharacterized protein GlcG (DUF336 family)
MHDPALSRLAAMLPRAAPAIDKKPRRRNRLRAFPVTSFPVAGLVLLLLPSHGAAREMRMSVLTLDQAQTILSTALRQAVTQNLSPLAIVVLDGRGALKAFAAQDGTSLKRGEIAIGKARGALALGMGSRSLFRRAKEQPFFIAAAGEVVGDLIPVPGGVLIRDAEGAICGVVGISGDTSDNDEACAVAGIEAASFRADPGQD